MPDEVIDATLLGDSESMPPGQLLRLCNVNGRLVAVAPEPGSWGLPPADAALVEPVARTKRTSAERFGYSGTGGKIARILIAGCDPSVSILAHSLQAQGCELVIV